MIDPTAPWSSALPDFLLARYDEAQRRAELAQQVIAGDWDCWEVVAQQLHACCDTVPAIGRVGQMLQIDADPARVLAELTAKRRHVAMWMEARLYLKVTLDRLHAAEDDVEIKRASHDYSEGLGMQAVTEELLHLDALDYTDHPAFLPEWRIADD